MKRSEIIKEIVKKSYDARVKALQEAAKDQKIAPGAVPAAPAAASAPSNSSGTSGASISGGNSTRLSVPVIILRKLKSKLVKNDKVFILPSKKRESDYSDIIYAVANNKENALDAIVQDSDLIEGRELGVGPVPTQDIDYFFNPFENGHEIQEPILKEPITQESDLYDIVVSTKPLVNEEVYNCMDWDINCADAFEAYDFYEVLEDNPDDGDFKADAVQLCAGWKSKPVVRTKKAASETSCLFSSKERQIVQLSQTSKAMLQEAFYVGAYPSRML